MASITTRAGKGSPLTNAELDANFTNINTELAQKLIASDLAPYLTSSTASSTYQPILVSGTSIKTVNGQSVLGSGNIQIDGGVASFNTRTGAVSLTSGDVTTALGFTPFSAAGGAVSGYATVRTSLSLGGSSVNPGQIGFNRNVETSTVINSSYSAYQIQNTAGTLALQYFNSSGGYVGQHTFDADGVVRLAGNTAIGGTAIANTRLRVVGAGSNSDVARIESATVAAYLLINQLDDPSVNSSRSGISFRKNNVSGGSISVDVDSTGRGVVFYDAWGATGQHAFYLNSVERLRLNVNGAVALSGSYGTSGQFLKTAGSTGAASWSSLSSGDVTAALGFTPISGNQTITVSGDATGSGTTGIALTLANSGVSAGTYTKVTVDAKGRVTTGASLASGDLPTYTGTITSSQVTTALGYTPYNSSNPSSYIDTNGTARTIVENNGTVVGTRRALNFIPGTGISLSISDDSANEEVDITITSTVSVPVTSVFGRTGAVTLQSSDVTGALGFTPYNATNPSGYITSSALSSYLPLSGGSLTGAVTSSGSFTSTDNANVNGSNFAVDTTNKSASLYAYDVRRSGTTVGGITVAGVGVFASGTTIGGSTAVHAGNYNTYSPTLTGTGASGTWGISISGNAATATTATTANALNTGNSYTGTGFTATTAQAYIVANRTSSSSGQVGYNWAQGGTNLWWSYVDTGNTTLSWYNSVALQNVMTLTTGGALNTAGAITQNGSQVLTAGNYTSYAPSLTGSGASGTWGINISGSAATLTTARTLTIGNTGKTFNGSANVSWSLAEIGALPTAGGTITTSGSSASLIVSDTGVNGANLRLSGDGATTPNKTLRARAGIFEIINSAYSAVCMQVTDAGNVIATGNVTAYSDERLKSNWSDLPTDFVERLAQVKHGTYTRLDSGERQAGSSAQDWQKLLPEVVYTGDDSLKTLSLNYGNAALVAAIQLARRVVELERRLEKMGG